MGNIQHLLLQSSQLISNIIENLLKSKETVVISLLEDNQNTHSYKTWGNKAKIIRDIKINCYWFKQKEQILKLIPFTMETIMQNNNFLTKNKKQRRNNRKVFQEAIIYAQINE